MNGGWCPIDSVDSADGEYKDYNGLSDKSGEDVDEGKKCRCPFGFTGERCESTLSYSADFLVGKTNSVCVWPFCRLLTHTIEDFFHFKGVFTLSS